MLIKLKSNKIKKLFNRVISLLVVASLIAPTVFQVPAYAAPSKYVKSLKLSKTSASVTVGKSTKVKTSVKVKGKASKYVKVKSSNTKVATVSVGKPNSKGVSTITIKGKKKGTAVIAVKTKGKNSKNKYITKKIKVTVKKTTTTSKTDNGAKEDDNSKDDSSSDYVKSLKILDASGKEVTSYTLEVKGSALELVANVSRTNNDVSNHVTVTSSDTSVAKVTVDNYKKIATGYKNSSDITITPLKAGSATITVKTKANGKSGKAIQKNVGIVVKGASGGSGGSDNTGTGGTGDTGTSTTAPSAEELKNRLNNAIHPSIQGINSLHLVLKDNTDPAMKYPGYVYVPEKQLSYNSGDLNITSSNSSVATIRKDGVLSYVKALSPGTATVTIKTKAADKNGNHAVKTLTVNVSTYTMGEPDAKGRPPISANGTSDEIKAAYKDVKCWFTEKGLEFGKKMFTGALDYDDLEYYLKAEKIYYKGYYKEDINNPIVPYSQLNSKMKETLKSVGNTAYVAKIEPEFEGYCDYWVKSINNSGTSNNSSIRSSGHVVCYNGEKNKPYQLGGYGTNGLTGKMNDPITGYNMDGNIPPKAARLIENQGLVAYTLNYETGERHWYRTYIGINIFGPKEAGHMGLGPYLKMPDGSEPSLEEKQEAYYSVPGDRNASMNAYIITRYRDEFYVDNKWDAGTDGMRWTDY